MKNLHFGFNCQVAAWRARQAAARRRRAQSQGGRSRRNNRNNNNGSSSNNENNNTGRNGHHSGLSMLSNFANTCFACCGLFVVREAEVRLGV